MKVKQKQKQKTKLSNVQTRPEFMLKRSNRKKNSMNKKKLFVLFFKDRT